MNSTPRIRGDMLKRYREVAEYRKANPNLNQREVAKALNCSQTTVSRAVRWADGEYNPDRDHDRQHTAPKFPEYQLPEDVNWREFLQKFTEAQELHERIDPRQSLVTIDLRDQQDDVMIVSASDLHMGGGFTNHREIQRTMELILMTPGMYVGITGDTIEGFIPGAGAGKVSETVEQQVASMRAQVNAYQSLVKDLTDAGKLLWMSWGDHDGKWFEQTIGWNIFKQMVDRHVPYFSARGLIKLLVGDQEYYVVVNHGERWSSQWSRTHPQRRVYGEYFPADVVISGHRHMPEWRVAPLYNALQEAGFNLGGKAIFVQNGTFKTGPDSYSCRSWEHGIIGVPTLLFQADRRDKHVFEGPNHALFFREGRKAVLG